MPPLPAAPATVVTSPLVTSMVRMRPPEGNATTRLSGDQNGRPALSVPGNSRASIESSARSHNRGG